MACPQIVVLEDDPDIRETVSEILQGEGYTIAAFENGKEALAGMANCKEACLILCDLMMPVMSGMEFLDARQNLGDTIVGIPVFIVSAVPEQAKNRTDVSGFIRKPIDMKLLLQIVQGHCGPARMSA